MTLLLEGTLQLDGQSIPARLTLEIDRAQLAALLASPAESGDVGPQRREWRGDIAAPQTALRPAAKRGGFEPIEIRPHPGRRITFDMLEWITDPAKRWKALAERFPWAEFKVPAGTPELTAGELAGVANTAESGGAISQLDSDWLTIEPYLDELVRDDGRPVRGYQSRIAEMLGGSNDGHFRRARVEPLVQRFKAWVTEEWVFTSSSAAPDDEDESAETGETARVA